MEVNVDPDDRCFAGVLQEIQPDYVVINGCGFPVDVIRTIRRG